MDANANGVAARTVDHYPAGEGVERLLRRLKDQISRPLVIVAISVATLAAALAPGLVSGSRSPADDQTAEIAIRLDLLASLAAHEAARVIGLRAPAPEDAALVADALPSAALPEGTTLHIFDADGFAIAAIPRGARSPRRVSDLFSDALPSTPATAPSPLSVRLPGGTEALAAVRELRSGHLAVLRAVPTRAQRTLVAGLSTLTLAIVFGLAALGAGCLWHGSRANAATSDRALLRRRLETSLARSRCGLWDWDIAGGRIFWSASMYALLGYEPRDADLSIGELCAILHPGDLDLREVARQIEGGACFQVDQEFRARTAAGRWVWLRARADVVRERDGRRRLVGIAVDVTDEHAAAARRATDDARLREAVEAISEAFVLWDAENRLVLCNSKFRDLHDLSPETAAPGARYAAVIEAVRPSVVENRLAAGFPQGGDGRTIEKHLADGRWLQISERRTRDGGFVSVGTDITPLKHHEGKLVASERRLLAALKEQRRSRRDAQIQAQQLAELAERYHEGKHLAEQASQAKTEFLAKVSHELRTPLNAIIGFADMMRGEVLGPIGCPRYAEYSRDIHGSGMKLLATIDSILSVSQIEAGRVTLATEPVDARAVLEAAAAAVGAEAAMLGSTVSVDAGDSVVLWADPTALRTVLVQLLENAIRFSGPGTVVRLKMRAAGEYLNVFVADAGAGIPATFLERLGHPFEQAENEYCRAGGGFGLGLAIARGLTELHGGRLRVRSAEGVGTAVLVHVPLVGAAANDGDARRPTWTRPRPYLVAAE